MATTATHVAIPTKVMEDLILPQPAQRHSQLAALHLLHVVLLNCTHTGAETFFAQVSDIDRKHRLREGESRCTLVPVTIIFMLCSCVERVCCWIVVQSDRPRPSKIWEMIGFIGLMGLVAPTTRDHIMGFLTSRLESDQGGVHVDLDALEVEITVNWPNGVYLNYNQLTKPNETMGLGRKFWRLGRGSAARDKENNKCVMRLLEIRNLASCPGGRSRCSRQYSTAFCSKQ